MKKKIMIAAGVALLAAAVSTSVYVNNGRNPMDDLFSANVEALARNEGGTNSCYRHNDYGPMVYGIFCHPFTQPPVIYNCSPAYTDRMGGISSCY